MAQPEYVPEDSIGLRVRLLREVHGLSQREAAEKCGLTFGEWQGLEIDRAVRDIPRKLVAISQGLAVNGMNVSIDWLLWGNVRDHETTVRFSRKPDTAGQDRFSGSDMDVICDGFSPEITGSEDSYLTGQSHIPAA